jgi:hypothetical protein
MTGTDGTVKAPALDAGGGRLDREGGPAQHMETG